MQNGTCIEINGQKKDYDLTSINNGPSVSNNIETSVVDNQPVEPQPPIEPSTPPQPTEPSTPPVPPSNVDNTNVINNLNPNNKKVIIIIAIVIGILIVLGIFIFIATKLLGGGNDLPGTYGCYKLENSWRDEYSEVIMINKNGTWKLGDYEDFDTDYLAGSYKSKKLAGSKKGVLDVSLSIKEDVTNGKSKPDSGVIGVYVGKMKNGKYDFTYKDGTTMICEKGITLGKNTTTTTESTTTSTKVNNYTEAQKAPFIGDLDEIYSKDSQVYGKVQIKQGSLKPGDAIQIIGAGKTIDTKVVKILHLVKGTELDVALYDDRATGISVNVYFENVNRDDLVAGMTIIEPNAYKTTKKYEALFSLACESNADYSNFSSDTVLDFTFNYAKSTGRIIIPEGKTPADLCKSTSVTILIDEDYLLTKGTTAIIYDKDRVYIGVASITNAIQE